MPFQCPRRSTARSAGLRAPTGSTAAALLDDDAIPAGAHAFTWIAGAIDDAGLSTTDEVPIYEPGDCPGDATNTTETIADARRTMLETGDTARAKALVTALGGPSAVQSWLDDAGLSQSRFVDHVGCADNTTTPDDLVARPPPTDASALEPDVRAIVEQEAAALPATARDAFLASLAITSEGDRPPATTQRSIAGRLDLARCDTPIPQTWIFALAVERADDFADDAFAASRAELLRIVLREALETCR